MECETSSKLQLMPDRSIVWVSEIWEQDRGGAGLEFDGKYNAVSAVLCSSLKWCAVSNAIDWCEVVCIAVVCSAV